MDFVDRLMEEHRFLREVLDSFFVFVERSQKSTPQEKETLGQFVEFFREFADRTHHGKEEDILFSLMVEQELWNEEGWIGKLLGEHEEGRIEVSLLKNLAEQEEPWSDKDRKHFQKVAKTYIGKLSHHMEREDRILFPRVKADISPQAMEEVQIRFQNFKAKEEASGNLDRLRKLGESLKSLRGSD